jgi:hypothetical protein
MASTDVLLRLQAWYADQSDGEWEHSYGVRIATLDNPGWTVRIDLNGTSVQDRDLDREEVHRSDEDWLVVWRDDAAQWHAACGPHNLEEAVERFLSWARPDDLASTSATLESSNGNASLTLRRVGDVLYTELRWVAQAWELDDPPTSTLTLYRVGIPDTLRRLSNDLRAHLARPLAELAGSPFTGSYDLGARHARINLDFSGDREGFVSTRSNGGGVLVISWGANNSSIEVATRVDITTLDNFAADLGDLAGGLRPSPG